MGSNAYEIIGQYLANLRQLLAPRPALPSALIQRLQRTAVSWSTGPFIQWTFICTP
jgi:hypothetical protein